jgi:hypothetical protein
MQGWPSAIFARMKQQGSLRSESEGYRCASVASYRYAASIA